MNRVEVTNPFCGLIAMQVCAVNDATDEEILEVCNRENPAGTTNGWASVMHDNDDTFGETAPVKCLDYESRTHYIVMC